jgi:aminoglycoside phosphotransferase (APT) family kinase protein
VPNPAAGPSEARKVGEALAAWAGDRLPGAPEAFEVREFVPRASNEILRVSRGDAAWILRKPPAVAVSPTAHNVSREYRILSALEGSAVPHPRAVALCEDTGVIGTPFMIMDLVPGFTPAVPLPAEFDEPARRLLATEFIRGLAAVHAVDWRRDLHDLGKPAGYLERQVRRWLSQMDRGAKRPLDGLQDVASWLERSRPAGSEPTLVHGDYQLRNVIFAPGTPARLAAVVDWEQGTVGDPLLDLAWTLTRWAGPGGTLPTTPPGDSEVTALPGLLTRAELIEEYTAASGRAVTHLKYYEVLCYFKLACILESRYQRVTSSGFHDPAGTAAEWTVPALLRAALDKSESAG